ncbi:MAG: Fis family transcriptional regulator [Bacteroidetes bacterium RIFCSPLOWO2_12_FULL_37_12]|nr:MAG: Fis family transcriptional regulator [Bacteroidetes bacterium RIFCSPLOWO2_12_FULL_37_12]
MSKILIIDDEKTIRNTLKDILEYEGYEIHLAEDGISGFEKLKNISFDACLCDIKMPKMDGMELLEKAILSELETPIIMISAHGSIETAVEAVKKGAYDFIQKPPDLNRVLITVRNALEKTNLVTETKILRRRVSKTNEIIGETPVIQKIKETIDRVAPTDARVLITGNNGTGKELVAKWLHEKSARKEGPVIEVNCAAIPSELIESELFGHEKGAFTSAIKQRIGKFEQANGGTLFLDEIGDMSQSAQSKVLRALQENKIMRVGGDKEIPVDVRVIAATNKDLLKEIDENRFRMDLYHRLSVILIHIPSLDERKDDIPLLAERFLTEICEEYAVTKKQFTPKAIKLLKEMEWPGNIRELHNVIERLVILSSDKINEEEIELYAMKKPATASELNIYDRFEKFQEFKEYAEKEFIKTKLNKFNWNVTKAADSIDIQRSHLYNKMERYNLSRKD